MSVSAEWSTVRLGDVVKVNYGRPMQKAKRAGGPVPVYGSNGVVGQHDVPLTTGPTIIIGRKGSSGAINVSAVACWPIDTTYYIDDPGPYSLPFLERLLRSLRLEELDRSTAIPGLSREQLYDLEVPLPPPEEQQDIADLLGQAERKTESSRARLKAAALAMQRFRQAVIYSGCRGEMSQSWRESHPDEEPMDSVLARHAAYNQDVPINKRRLKAAPGLRLIGDEFTFPELWAFMPIRELVGSRAIVDVQDGNHGELYPRKDDFTTNPEDGIPYISAESVSRVVLIESAPRLKHDVASRLRIGFARAGDVILTHNATVGRVAVLPPDSPDVVLSTSTTYYRSDPRVLLPDYLALYMRSHFFQQQLAAVMEQTTRNQVPVTKQVELSVAVPPIEEQREIVRLVELLLDLGDDVSDRLGRAAQSVERSANSVLAKTFGSASG